MNTNTFEDLYLLEDVLETFELQSSFNPQQAVKDILDTEDYLFDS